MARKNSQNQPKTDKEMQARFGITPGADISEDPEKPPTEEWCSVCGANHPTHGIGGGD